MSRNIFQGNSSSNNIFTNNSNSQSQNNIFTRNQQNSSSGSNNIFSQNNRSGSSSNIFNNQNTQGNSQSNNIFNNQNQGQGQGQRQGQNQTNIFSNNNQGSTNNIFSNQGNSNNQGNSIFSNQGGQQSNNIFNNGNQQNSNIFTQNNRQNNNYNYNQQPQTWNPQLHFQEYVYYFTRSSPELQSQHINSLKMDQIKSLVQNCLKSLIEPSKLQALSLSEENIVRYEKANKLADKLGIKKELLFLKKEVKDNIISPISSLKKQNEQIGRLSKEISEKLLDKLTKLKEKLIEATTQHKMVSSIKQEVDEIDNQIKDFVRPLFNSSQGKSNFNFIDPDPFCIKISQRILKNITSLDNKMDELIACESQVPQQAIDITHTIEQLIEYYENVAISLKEFADNYNRIKKAALTKRRGNPDAGLEHIRKKANEKIDKQLKAYKLLKEVEEVLEKRNKQKAQH